eukprot:3588154-Rhodomonas_salina.5
MTRTEHESSAWYCTPLSAYALATLCPVLTYYTEAVRAEMAQGGQRRRTEVAMSGTDLAYRAIGLPARCTECGTDLSYGTVGLRAC